MSIHTRIRHLLFAGGLLWAGLQLSAQTVADVEYATYDNFPNAERYTKSPDTTSQTAPAATRPKLGVVSLR